MMLGLVPLLPFNRINMVITDEDVPVEKERLLGEQEISLLKVTR
jgi:hypothetical protein